MEFEQKYHDECEPINVTIDESNQYKLRRMFIEYQKMRTLVSLLTVNQVISAGYDYINAAGLNPWCMNEGLATGNERLSSSDYLTDEQLEELWIGLSL